ncbi:NAD-dependent epimerase/dehydratase family protein [Gordonia soli]|uniref:NAD-dependent epimerase/dehydratase family protein n=1 Tax=Gordonia soli NBRC 108243 TaxID=1223545 RepID=M0QHM6_9ACTN|nr:NAD-dependent epimerase/dehydratase family protein [Gordonia soli]GAC67806.1 NAD-dependent epimerase/dehydratase family protein [Gordonia soli NBRC 108243]
MILVIGATGFLGSHVVRQVAASGETVRVLTRTTSDLRPIADVPVDHVVGELTDTELVRRAMAGCSAVVYCAVDTRAWLLDPAPLYATNVDALRAVLEVAADAGLEKFVYTSSMATIGRPAVGPATEDDPFDWADTATEYVLSRVAAEDMVLSRARAGAVPAVAMCVSNTYGSGDWAPTPHGAFVAGAALGRLRFTVRGFASEAVAVDDAAAALVSAIERGRPGERYIVSERFIDLAEVIDLAARTGGHRPPRPALPRPALYGLGAAGSALARLRRRPQKLTVSTVRLMHHMSPMSHAKAEHELDWHPRPVTDAVVDAARFWIDRVAARGSSRQPTAD